MLDPVTDLSVRSISRPATLRSLSAPRWLSPFVVEVGTVGASIEARRADR
jgi:hypothetical protein